MREVVGSIFDVKADAIVIPCNWRVKRTGEAVMGAGVAKEAAARFPSLPGALGGAIQGSRLPYIPVYQCGPATHLVCFPTKRDWRKPSDLTLIDDQLPWLVSHADIGGWQTVALPRLGCGLGQLDWATQVRPLLSGLLDDRFVVCSLEPTAATDGEEEEA